LLQLSLGLLQLPDELIVCLRLFMQLARDFVRFLDTVFGQ
jgi:hypothetical protein